MIVMTIIVGIAEQQKLGKWTALKCKTLSTMVVHTVH